MSLHQYVGLWAGIKTTKQRFIFQGGFANVEPSASIQSSCLGDPALSRRGKLRGEEKKKNIKVHPVKCEDPNFH